ncbi:hypothetical protein [Malikia spinosa]|uniref:hypothetical protein n=1 Tax=Malikia spinosa TaxID=86180 RepID=UPI003FA1B2F5
MNIKFKQSFKLLAIAGLISGLAACGGGSDAPAKVATADTTFTMGTANAQTAATLLTTAAKSFSFASGVPALGTTVPTTVSFAGTAASPTFAVSSSAGTANGTMGFGSCILTITNSTFTSGPMAPPLPKTITISPCEVAVDTSGDAVGTPVANETATLSFGTTVSQPANLTGNVTVNDAGQVTITQTDGSSIVIGTVPVTTPTGTATGSI